MADMKNPPHKNHENPDKDSNSPNSINWPEKLQTYAYWYLGRYACSSAKLAEKLRLRAKRLDPSLDKYAVRLPASLEIHIEAILEKLVKLKLLNDDQLLQSRIESLRRSGHSNRKISDKLRQGQFSYSDIKSYLYSENRDNDGDTENPDAETLAGEIKIKKILQGYRRKYPIPSEEDSPNKAPPWPAYAMDKMLRAGFSYPLIKTLLEKQDIDGGAP